MGAGEIRRTLDRHEMRLMELARSMVPSELWDAQHRALAAVVADLKADMLARFAQVESTSLERKSALIAKNAELEAALASMRQEFLRRLDAIVAEFDGKLAAERERSRSEESNGSSRTANIIAAVIAIGTIAAVLIALLGQGGH
jgi:hypothetical protein